MPEERPIRVLVVDDEPAARDVVTGFLAEDASIQVVGEAGNGRQAVDLIRELEPDLLFLDVQMPDLDGFAVLEALDGKLPPAVVFVTAHDEHALRAFEVHAMDYLLKPFGRPRFRKALSHAIGRLEADDALATTRRFRALMDAGGASRLGVRLGARTILIDADRIDWIEADDDHTRIHAEDRTHLASARIYQLEAQLDPERFFRIHRSVIVNLDRVRELRREGGGGGRVLLASGASLPVARGRWAALEEALGV